MQRLERKFPSSSRETAYRVLLTIDSRSRENKERTQPNDYIVKFPSLSKVVAARLISAEVPNSQYVVNSRNNIIDMKDGSGTYTVTITPGTYTAVALADEINEKLNLAVGVAPDVNFTVEYILSTQKMRITRVLGGTFSILWKSGAHASQSISRVLGFTEDKSDVTVMSSDLVVNLSGEPFVYLVIDKFDAKVHNSESIKDVFAKIILNIPPRFVCFDSFVSNTVQFTEPMHNVDRLRVRFVQQDGSLYDFNGLDHSLSLELFLNA